MQNLYTLYINIVYIYININCHFHENLQNQESSHIEMCHISDICVQIHT